MADGSVTGDVRELRQMLADCEQYLKDGGQPAQRIERRRRDTEAVLNLLIREKRKNDAHAGSVAALSRSTVLRETTARPWENTMMMSEVYWFDCSQRMPEIDRMVLVYGSAIGGTRYAGYERSLNRMGA